MSGGLTGGGSAARPQPIFGMPTNSYANSGLARFSQGPEFHFPSYTPQMFQPPSFGASSGPAAPSAPLFGGGGSDAGSAGGGFSGQGGTGQGGSLGGMSLGGMASALGPTAAGLAFGPLGFMAANAVMGPSSQFGMGQQLASMYGLNNIAYNAPFADEASGAPGGFSAGSYGDGVDSMSGIGGFGSSGGFGAGEGFGVDSFGGFGDGFGGGFGGDGFGDGSADSAGDGSGDSGGGDGGGGGGGK